MTTNDIKSDTQVAAEAASVDTGFCNPRKIAHATEARLDAIFALESRGYTRAEAEQMIAEQE